MIIIAHRGNVEGPNPPDENNPDYIDHAILQGYDVEIDFWVEKGQFYLGHDSPKYPIDIKFLFERSSRLWIHCKNIEAIERLDTSGFNYFWHDKDFMTITSQGYLWVYPGRQPVKKSIAVLPEMYNDPIYDCYGICTDYADRYAYLKNH
jgi:hypothetical protein